MIVHLCKIYSSVIRLQFHQKEIPQLKNFRSNKAQKQQICKLRTKSFKRCNNWAPKLNKNFKKSTAYLSKKVRQPSNKLICRLTQKLNNRVCLQKLAFNRLKNLRSLFQLRSRKRFREKKTPKVF